MSDGNLSPRHPSLQAAIVPKRGKAAKAQAAVGVRGPHLRQLSPKPMSSPSIPGHSPSARHMRRNSPSSSGGSYNDDDVGILRRWRTGRPGGGESGGLRSPVGTNSWRVPQLTTRGPCWGGAPRRERRAPDGTGRDPASRSISERPSCERIRVIPLGPSWDPEVTLTGTSATRSHGP